MEIRAAVNSVLQYKNTQDVLFKLFRWEQWIPYVSVLHIMSWYDTAEVTMKNTEPENTSIK